MRKSYWLITLVLFTACSSSKITSSWKNPNTAIARKYEKVLVLGLIEEPDRMLREKMEQHMADDLKILGYNAVTSVSEYGPKAFEGMSEAGALQSLSTKGIDAVVTIVLLAKEKEVYYPSSWSRSDRLWGYYTYMHDRVYTASYPMTNTKYFWESNLFDMNDWLLVYSVQSQSFEPGSARKLAHEYGQLIVNDMVKGKVLEKQEAKPKAF
jgi:hypothetical protein